MNAFNTTLTIKTPKKLRDAAKRTANKLGIPLTTVINAQLAQFVSEGRFEVSLKPRPEKVREWEAVQQEYREHPGRFAVTDMNDFIHELRG